VNNDEYIRRNEVTGIAAGLRADLILMNSRVQKNPKGWPKWLIQGLEQAARRSDEVFEEMVRYRDRAHGES